MTIPDLGLLSHVTGSDGGAPPRSASGCSGADAHSGAQRGDDPCPPSPVVNLLSGSEIDHFCARRARLVSLELLESLSEETAGLGKGRPL